MEQTKKQEAKSPVVREYKIGDITYIVKAVAKDGVREDAATKVRRLIQNDLKREKSPV
ncbi:MAG TPA: transposon-encoded TnpW family protein [Candidatus Agathobaculum intestinipullorum]|nr:transposon-encoded TnpW family protein [Candidatus Agathobaculum intestinipullorum]